MKTTITTKKTGAGHYQVSLYLNGSLHGTFELTDMQILDDIHEMINDGSESELSHFETFEQVEDFCVSKIEVKGKREYVEDGKLEHFTKFDGTQTR